MTEPPPPSPDRPDASERPCAECGHVWFAGERRHAYVPRDDDDDPGEVEVLCILCIAQRARPSGAGASPQ